MEREPLFPAYSQGSGERNTGACRMRAEDSIKDVRLKKLEEMRLEGEPPYPNGFRRTTTTEALQERFDASSSEDLEGVEERFALAGRIVAMRDFGKSCFLHIQDESGRLQLYLRKNVVGDGAYANFRRWADIGDLLGAEGRLFRTRTGELTLQVDRYQLLAKALRPLPEKFHGLRDIELRYRKRYLDLMVNPDVRATFRLRAEIIRWIRGFFDGKGFLEVETPMMHPIAGGATARPFKTFHNALEQSLYLRIAPELYLKRLLVGGFTKVYELNKNFRNEGLSTRHNPEFTMIEFYEAYARYEDFMSLTEELLCGLLNDLFGTHRITYQGVELDFTPPWRRLSLEEALADQGGFSEGETKDPAALRATCERVGIDTGKMGSHGELLAALFERIVEERLIQPTFVTHYPLAVSPLARSTEGRSDRVDRFELYVAGREVANGFSELNDPEEQRRRFLDQVEKRRQGDDTAQEMDEDFLEALEFGMPPAAGEGIGMDRLVMLLTDSPSIRDVILFPQMRSEKGIPQKP
jgi:lysyl-tRNA synthetase class 2